MSPGWLPLTVFAHEAKTNPKTMKRRLLALARARGRNQFLLSTKQPGKRPRRYWVHPELLKAELERDPDVERSELDDHAAKIEKLEEFARAIKTWRKHLKARGFFNQNRL